jgi:two-component system, NarL family, nitrate/nitrite response regulator NarL
MHAGFNASGLRCCHPQLVGFTVLIVDDNAAFLDAARTLLEAEGLSVVALASTASEAAGFCTALKPELALVDVTLSGESGFDVARQLSELSAPPAVILISTHAEGDFVELITESPARGFLPKAKLSAEAIRSLMEPAASAEANGSSDR